MDKSERVQEVKTWWGWLQFPVLLALLVAGIFWLHLQQDSLAQQLSRQQRTIALQTAQAQQQQILLTNYMDTITNLMVNNKLLTATTLDPAAVIAEAQRQNVLIELDHVYKMKVMYYLYCTIDKIHELHVINMANADL